MANDFKINGTSLTHQPSEHKWVEREAVGIDGNGRGIYPAIREYELSWDYLTATEFNELYTYFSAIGNTGSAVVSLPQYGASSYTFFAYTGCILREPTYDSFFEEYYADVRMLVARIRT